MRFSRAACVLTRRPCLWCVKRTQGRKGAAESKAGEDHGSKAKCRGGETCVCVHTHTHTHTHTHSPWVSPTGRTLKALLLVDFMRQTCINKPCSMPLSFLVGKWSEACTRSVQDGASPNYSGGTAVTGVGIWSL